MDKYEYKLKLDQLKSFLAEGNDESAARIADEINWKKVRNANTLCMVGDLYDRLGRYEECREVLQQAYDHSPVGRAIVGRLTQNAIKARQADEAEEYYQEFVGIAPQDNLRYILAYQISCLKEAPLPDRIAILEELKEHEYTEKWAYELAALYSQADMRDKCVEACDELILWFGDGEYVRRALDLKRKYQPLTTAQEEKLRQLEESARVVEISLSKIAEEKSAPGAESLPEITVTASKFNTVNLQEELASSMRQIMNATQKETVSDTMDSIKKLVGDIPYLQSETQKEQAFDKEKINEQVDETLKEDFRERLDQNTKEMLGEDADGQISMNVPEQKEPEEQVAGQMSIEDVLAEWEKTRKAAEEAIAAAEKKKLEMSKERALREAGDIMERLKKLIPVLSATPGEDIPGEEETVAASLAPETPAAKQDSAEQQISAKQRDSAEQQIPLGQQDSAEQQIPVEQPAAAGESRDIRSAESRAAQGAQAEGETGSRRQKPVEDEELKHLVEQGTQVMAEHANVEVPVEAGGEAKSALDGSSEIPLPDDLNPRSGGMGTVVLNEEQRELFSYFLPVPGMEEQICQILTGASERKGTSVTSLSGNILVQGEEGSGKTVLATSLIKALQKVVGKEGAKIGKISAAALNHKDFKALVPRIAGGYLIIDKAGDLTRETAVRMSQVMEQNTQGMVVLLEDTKEGIRRAMNLDFGFSKKFTEKITIPIFTIDELVDFGKSYAEEMECTIDEMGVLALYNRINNIQKLEHATTLTEVKEIVDEAIENAEGGGIRRAFGAIFSKKYNENDYLILREKDFGA